MKMAFDFLNYNGTVNNAKCFRVSQKLSLLSWLYCRVQWPFNRSNKFSRKKLVVLKST